jgi:hypothetical protein
MSFYSTLVNGLFTIIIPVLKGKVKYATFQHYDFPSKLSVKPSQLAIRFLDESHFITPTETLVFTNLKLSKFPRSRKTQTRLSSILFQNMYLNPELLVNFPTFRRQDNSRSVPDRRSCSRHVHYGTNTK